MQVVGGVSWPGIATWLLDGRLLRTVSGECSMKYASSNHPRHGHNDVRKLAGFNCVGLLGWVLYTCGSRGISVLSLFTSKAASEKYERLKTQIVWVHSEAPFDVKGLHTSPILSFVFEDFIN